MSTTVPLVDPQRGWRMWYRPEIYTGPAGLGRFVPNVDDFVLDYQNGFFRVTAVNSTTFISTLEVWRQPDNVDGVIAQDLLLGVGPGYQAESYRAYIHTAETPHVMALDARLRVYGSKAAYCKVFSGVDISSTGNVISALLDANGAVITENLPLELAEVTGGNNLNVKVVSQGYSVETMQDGAVVTAVFYDADGNVLSLAKLLVKVTNFIRTTDANRKYVSSIELLSPFLSQTDNQLLEYPINMLVQSGSFRAKVNYNDGSHLELPVDGTRFRLMGIDSYIASVVGQRIPLLLSYNFSNNEFGYTVSGVAPERFMTQEYQIVTTDLVGAYSVKLFVVPVWVSPTVGYRLEYYLYNLDRDIVYYVTPFVSRIAPNANYNPFPTGNVQTIQARIELSSIGASYGYYVHTQTFNLVLLSSGTDTNNPNWTIQYTPGGPLHGGNFALNAISTGSDQWTLNFGLNALTELEWLTNLYYSAEPLLNPVNETVGQLPTHFRLRIGDTYVIERQLSQYNQPITNANISSNDLFNGQTARFEFIRRVGMDVLELSLGILQIRIA